MKGSPQRAPTANENRRPHISSGTISPIATVVAPAYGPRLKEQANDQAGEEEKSPISPPKAHHHKPGREDAASPLRRRQVHRPLLKKRSTTPSCASAVSHVKLDFPPAAATPTKSEAATSSQRGTLVLSAWYRERSSGSGWFGHRSCSKGRGNSSNRDWARQFQGIKSLTPRSERLPSSHCSVSHLPTQREQQTKQPTPTNKRHTAPALPDTSRHCIMGNYCKKG